MPLFGQLFLSEILKRPVYDPNGEVLGRVTDVILVRGEYLPNVLAFIVTRHGRRYRVPWRDLEIVNRRILSTRLTDATLQPYEESDDDLLGVRDVLDKQIVDANGAKVVRVNDVKLEGHNGDAVLIAVDVGLRGILRRLGIERRSEQVSALAKVHLPHNLIGWNYIQPLTPKLRAITLTVPRQMVSELHPADIAEIISQVSPDEGRHLVSDLDVKTAAEALSELKPERQVEIIASIDPERAADIIEEMPPDEASDVLGDLSTERAKEILEHIEKDEAEDIQELLGYEEDSAGGLMTTDFVAFPPHLTVREAVQRFRAEAEPIETVYSVFVVDEQEHLLGVLSLRDLLLADPALTLADAMEHKPRVVKPDTDQKEVAQVISKYNLVSLPVVDDDGCLLGVVTVDDVIDRILPSAVKRKRKGA